MPKRKKPKPTEGLSEKEKRSYTMSRIKSQDTSIEVALRKALYKAGVRYRVNYAKAPGKPDIAVTKYKIAIFCDGEFWHGFDWENKKNKINSRREYWIPKIERNLERDKENNRKLEEAGWAVLRFWGKEIEKDLGGCIEKALSAISSRSGAAYHEPDEANDLMLAAESDEGYQLSGSESCDDLP